MPKFLREKFDFNGTEAGIISSIPYAIASISVPIIGSFLRGKSDQVYKECMIFAVALIFGVHLFYLLLTEHIK